MTQSCSWAVSIISVTSLAQTYPNFDMVCIKKAVGLEKLSLKIKCQALWSANVKCYDDDDILFCEKLNILLIISINENDL